MGIIRCLISNLISFTVLSGVVKALNSHRPAEKERKGSNNGLPKDSSIKEER